MKILLLMLALDKIVRLVGFTARQFRMAKYKENVAKPRSVGIVQEVHEVTFEHQNLDELINLLTNHIKLLQAKPTS
ncbi:hypothetical protein ACFQ2O_03545 [Pontibacter rugosus]|uniref:Uncharacterized protein n=1 Tax=Pontibacter rugosus TaxID=1745966 RepID=A0ABW3SKP9_9BACT